MQSNVALNGIDLAHFHKSTLFTWYLSLELKGLHGFQILVYGNRFWNYLWDYIWCDVWVVKLV